MVFARVIGAATIAAAVGAGAAALAPGLIRAFRPTARKALADGIALVRRGQVKVEGAWEDLEDLLAEARAEADARARAQRAGATTDNVTPLKPDGAPGDAGA